MENICQFLFEFHNEPTNQINEKPVIACMCGHVYDVCLKVEWERESVFEGSKVVCVCVPMLTL